jgi:hypothetical protein
MPALNFKQQFVPLILSHQKCSTIRGKRKFPIKPCDVLKLYTGQRTSKCKLIGAAICSNVTPIKICEDAPYLFLHLGEYNKGVQPPGKWYKFVESALQHLCTNDGFASYDEMKTFFRNQYGLPFEGDFIEWKDFKSSNQHINKSSN